ncbi:MAG TPA: PEP-CTERM sorting domain-containing protein [Gemmatimonadaceae bacterium]|nr:PEP-CTERM sorting domain-containing protein [Gemmatimonadaceae bacterium]
MRRALAFASLVAALAVPSGLARAQTQVIGFEDVPPGAYLPVGYAGFMWTGVSAYNQWIVARTDDPDYASLARPTSGSASAFTGEGTALYMWLPEGTFDLNSLFMSELKGGPEPHDIDGSITGSRNGEVIYSISMPLNLTTMTEYDLNWTNIDRIDIGGIGGRLMIDDISVTATPEPSSIALFATGLVGIVEMQRRRSKRRVMNTPMPS